MEQNQSSEDPINGNKEEEEGAVGGKDTDDQNEPTSCDISFGFDFNYYCYMNHSSEDRNNENKEEEEGPVGEKYIVDQSEPLSDNESFAVDFNDYYNMSPSPDDTDNEDKEEEETQQHENAQGEYHNNEQNKLPEDNDYENEGEAAGHDNGEDEVYENNQIVTSNFTQTDRAVRGKHIIKCKLLTEDMKFLLCTLYLEMLVRRRIAALDNYQLGAVSVFDPNLDAPVDISQDPAFRHFVLNFDSQGNEGYQSRLVGPEDLLQLAPARSILKYGSRGAAGRKSVCFDDKEYVREVSEHVGFSGFACISVPTFYVSKLNTDPLRNLAGEFDNPLFWFIAADFETFLYDYKFLVVLTDSDYGCRLLVHTVALQQLKDFYEQTNSQVARRVIHGLEHMIKSHCAILIGPENDVIEERPDAIIASCHGLVNHNYQVFLICKDRKLIKWQATAKVIILTPDQTKALIDCNHRNVLYRPSKIMRLRKKLCVIVFGDSENLAAVTDLCGKEKTTKVPPRDPEELFQKLYAAIDEFP